MAETKKESQKKTKTKASSDTKTSANPKADNQKKQGQKSKGNQTSAPRNEQNQFWSIILFAVGILVALMTVIKGTSGWLGIHNLLLGTFGAAVFFVPVILIYTSIQIGMELLFSQIPIKTEAAIICPKATMKFAVT